MGRFTPNKMYFFDQTTGSLNRVFGQLMQSLNAPTIVLFASFVTVLYSFIGIGFGYLELFPFALNVISVFAGFLMYQYGGAVHCVLHVVIFRPFGPFDYRIRRCFYIMCKSFFLYLMFGPTILGIRLFMLLYPLWIYLLLWFSTLLLECDKYARPRYDRNRYQAQGLSQIANLSDFEMDQAVSFLESVAILIFQLSRAKAKKDQIVAITAFAKTFSNGKSMTGQLTKAFSEISVLPEFQSQGFMDYVDCAKESHSAAHNIWGSPGADKIRTFMLYVLSLGLFSRVGIELSSLGFSKIQEAAVKRKFSSKLGFVDSLVDMSLFVCTAGYQAYKGMSVSHILHTPESYAEFYDNVEIFRQDFSRYEASGQGAGVDHTNLMARLSELRDQYDSISLATQNLPRVDKKILLNVRGTLLSVEAKLKNEKICQASRDAPFSLLFAGPSGVGKSTLIEIVFAQFGKLRGLETTSEMKYVRSPVADFWDNFDSKMWCLVLDDIAWMTPKLGELDNSVGELLHIINNVPYVTNQASLEKKGTTPFLGQFVVGTTNTRDLNAHCYFSYPAAARRRFPFVVDVTMKKEYANKYGNLQAAELPGIPDIWDFKVNQIFACDKTVQEEVVLETSSISVFLQWFNSSVDTFYSKQNNVSDSVKRIHEAKLCNTCRLPGSVCTCLVPQGLVTFTAGSFFGICLQTLIVTWLPHIIGKIVLASVYNRLDYYLSSLRMNMNIWLGRKRNSFIDLGRKVQTHVLKVPTFFIIMIGVLSVASFVKYFSSSLGSQGEPVPMSQERENYYYTDSIEPTVFNGSDHSRCIDLSTLAKKVEANVVSAEIQGSRTHMNTRMLGIGGSLYLVNAHCVPRDASRIRTTLNSNRNGVGAELVSRIDSDDIVFDDDNDLALIRLRNLPPRKDIRMYFPKDKPRGQSKGVYVGRSTNGVITRIEMPRITYGLKNIATIPVPLYCAVSQSSVKTVLGDCGMPLIAECGQYASILGIHVLGGQEGFSQVAGATVVTQPMLEHICARMGDTIIDTEEPRLHAQNKERKLSSALHSRSVFRYMENGCASLHGSFVGFRRTPRSMVIPSPLAPLLEPYGISSDFTKPVMSGWRPWRIAALDMCDPVTELDSSILKSCTHAYIRDIRRSLPAGILEKLLEPYDEFTSLNGAEAIAYVDGLKRNTSAGAPFNESKKKHIEPCEPARGLLDPIKMKSEMQTRVNEVRSIYKSGVRYQPVFTAHLKDEPVSAKKATIGKTRVFCGAPMDWSVVVREYFLSHVRLIQNFKLSFECAIGVVAPSGEWGVMYEHITKHGANRIVAGDYKAYDKRMPPTLILACFDVLIALARESGNFSPEDLRAMTAIAYDVAFPLVDFNGDLVTFWGSNPSGHPLTVIINSLANSLYMRYVYVASGHNIFQFQDHVSLLTYGDDNIMSVSPLCSNFDHTVIVKELEAIGVTYTMADKESKSVPFVHISDTNFLKRSWSSTPRGYLAPLAEESIFKMLCVITRSKTITMEEQLSEIIRSAHSEWWHYGEEVFQERTEMLLDIIQKANLSLYFEERPLPSFYDLWDRYDENTKKTQLRI